MDTEAFEHYLSDARRRAAPAPGAFCGAAGGAPCGDVISVSLRPDGRRLKARFEAEGCAAAVAAGAAVAEAADGAELLEAALIGPGDVARSLGGLSPQGRHAAELAADALHRALGSLAASGSLSGSLEVPENGAERVLVAMSGGVDSSVAAVLERRRGAEVVAVTVKLWADRRTDASKSCCSPLAVLGARELAHGLGIPHFTLDLEETFRAKVVDRYVAGHREGRTPNPCVLCNGEVRLDAMLELGERLGCRSLVTGHYAQIEDDGEGPLLRAAEDAAKDQSYMLAGVRPETLARLRFPLARLTKTQVRRLAAEAGLAVASKAESQDLCFLAGEGKRSFLARHGGLRARPGDVVDRSGRRLARHRGHHEFTVGQRRGLGVGSHEPLYVLATQARENRVVVGPREELARERLKVRDVTLHRDGGRVSAVRLRYHARALGCRIDDLRPGRHRELELALEEPVYGAAPGQLACLLDGDLVVGHATIA